MRWPLSLQGLLRWPSSAEKRHRLLQLVPSDAAAIAAARDGRGQIEFDLRDAARERVGIIPLPPGSLVHTHVVLAGSAIPEKYRHTFGLQRLDMATCLIDS